MYNMLVNFKDSVSIKTLPYYCFKIIAFIFFTKYLSKLILFTIPSSITFILTNAFSWCQSLKHITIPSSIVSIDDFAFYNC